MVKDINAGAEKSMSYVNLLIELFRGLDADPAEALTATITATAVIGKGVGIDPDALMDIVCETVDDVFALNTEE